MDWIDQFISVLFVSGLISLPLFFIFSIKYSYLGHIKYRGVLRISTGVFVISILGIFLLSEILSYYSYQVTMDFLADIGEGYEITVDGVKEDDGAKILSILQSMDNSPFQAHHSHPTKRIKFAIKSHGESLELELGKDSERPNEYWVFYPKYKHTRANEISRVRTSIFERY